MALNEEDKHEIACVIQQAISTQNDERVLQLVESTVVKTLDSLGIKVNDVEEFRLDLAHLRRHRLGAKLLRDTVAKNCIGAVCWGGAALFLLGLKEWAEQHLHITEIFTKK